MKLSKKLLEIRPLTDRQAARHLAHTHPLTQQEDEKPEDFVLRIVQAYDNIKAHA